MKADRETARHHSRSRQTPYRTAPIPTAGALVVAMVSVFACGHSSGLSDADRTGIRELDSTYVAAWLRDDTAAVLATLAPGAVLMPSGQRPLTNLDAIRAFWWPRDGSRTRITAYTTTIDETSGSPDMAYVRGTGELAFTYEKDSMQSQVSSRNMTLTIVRRGTDGRWLIVHRMWGPLVQ